MAYNIQYIVNIKLEVRCNKFDSLSYTINWIFVKTVKFVLSLLEFNTQSSGNFETIIPWLTCSFISWTLACSTQKLNMQTSKVDVLEICYIGSMKLDFIIDYHEYFPQLIILSSLLNGSLALSSPDKLLPFICIPITLSLMRVSIHWFQ